MPTRVYTACRDCKNCTSSDLAHFGRQTGRKTAAIVTIGVSEAAMATKKKCRQCGHQMSLHGSLDSLPPTSATPVYPMGQWPPQPQYGTPSPGWQQPPPSTVNPTAGASGHVPAGGGQKKEGVFKRIHAFYTHSDPVTRGKRRYVTALVLVVFGAIGGVANLFDGEIGAGLFGLAIMVAAGMWVFRERSSAMLRAESNSDSGPGHNGPPEPEAPGSGDHPFEQ
ncbi:DUF4229 domain-containing protein [Rhodococcus sp. BP22]|uniref:DUF4229 domain-containing protein n=1 Tax=Rhodococcus sp. BP22 TaxID=2758566 RepID=UPI0016489DE0|nr:DUF4229 domain-containing protein [Rhodococcus sp. BP22]